MRMEKTLSRTLNKAQGLSDGGLPVMMHLPSSMSALPNEEPLALTIFLDVREWSGQARARSQAGIWEG